MPCSRSVSILVLGLVTAGSMPAQTAEGIQADKRPHFDARGMKRLFAKNCATCHAIPDPALATDRAWLERVKDTA